MILDTFVLLFTEFNLSSSFCYFFHQCFSHIPQIRFHFFPIFLFVLIFFYICYHNIFLSVLQGTPDKLKCILKENLNLVDTTLIEDTVLSKLDDSCRVHLSSHSHSLFTSPSSSYEHLLMSCDEDYGNYLFLFISSFLNLLLKSFISCVLLRMFVF